MLKMLIPASAGHSPLLIPLPLGRGSSKWLSGTTATVKGRELSPIRDLSLLSGLSDALVWSSCSWLRLRSALVAFTPHMNHEMFGDLAPNFSFFCVKDQWAAAQEPSSRCHLVATLRCHLGLSGPSGGKWLPVTQSITYATRYLGIQDRQDFSSHGTYFPKGGRTINKPPDVMVEPSVSCVNLASLRYTVIQLNTNLGVAMKYLVDVVNTYNQLIPIVSWH